ncbi:hypothetical protein BJ170DRAFT_113105 [Xylariales sp. AK1849]|nr:hypothetical protein BJ170DRAFT_113105 [Xylariales sp. AK1849]
MSCISTPEAEHASVGPSIWVPRRPRLHDWRGDPLHATRELWDNTGHFNLPRHRRVQLRIPVQNRKTGIVNLREHCTNPPARWGSHDFEGAGMSIMRMEDEDENVKLRFTTQLVRLNVARCKTRGWGRAIYCVRNGWSKLASRASRAFRLSPCLSFSNPARPALNVLVLAPRHRGARVSRFPATILHNEAACGVTPIYLRQTPNCQYGSEAQYLRLSLSSTHQSGWTTRLMRLRCELGRLSAAKSVVPKVGCGDPSQCYQSRGSSEGISDLLGTLHPCPPSSARMGSPLRLLFASSPQPGLDANACDGHGVCFPQRDTQTLRATPSSCMGSTIVCILE